MFHFSPLSALHAWLSRMPTAEPPPKHEPYCAQRDHWVVEHYRALNQTDTIGCFTHTEDAQAWGNAKLKGQFWNFKRVIHPDEWSPT